MEIWQIILAVVLLLLIIYWIFFTIFNNKVKKIENKIIGIFLLKASKIPGLIEVMRPFVADENIFENLKNIHSAVMIRDFESIYILLEHNARIHEQFAFLMKLGAQIPTLLTNSQFIYIRDFIMQYEKDMKADFAEYNAAATAWNTFVTVKNATIIGLILPGKKRELI